VGLFSRCTATTRLARSYTYSRAKESVTVDEAFHAIGYSSTVCRPMAL